MMQLSRPNSSLGLATIEEFDRIIDNFWKTPFGGLGSSLPSIDIYSEDDQHMVVEMQVPGFKQDDIEINVRDGVLEVKGEVTSSNRDLENKRNYLVRESRTSFARRIVLPDGAKANDISAEFDSGTLKLIVPVEQPKAQVVKINAQSNNEPKKLTAKTHS